MLTIVMDGVFGALRLRRKRNRERFAGLRIWFIEWGPGAGNRHADPVPFIEYLAEPTHIEGDFVDLARFEQRLAVKAIAITGSPRVVHDQNRPAVGIDIAEANQEIGVARCRGNE